MGLHIMLRTITDEQDNLLAMDIFNFVHQFLVDTGYKMCGGISSG